MEPSFWLYVLCIDLEQCVQLFVIIPIVRQQYDKKNRCFTLKPLSKDWFEMSDVSKRRFVKSVWVPVYGYKTIEKQKSYPEIGYFKEILAVGSAVIKQDYRDEAEKLDWSTYSDDYISAFIDSASGNYVAPEMFVGCSNKELGFRLVLAQSLNLTQHSNVEILQDFIFAYGLIEEGNKWVKPLAGYEEVIRVKRDENDIISFVEFRIEYLRDYLAARNSALRLYYYRERDAVFQEKPDFNFSELEILRDEDHDRCEIRSYDIDETGDIPRATWAILTARRTDVDVEEDLPDFSETTDENLSLIHI